MGGPLLFKVSGMERTGSALLAKHCKRGQYQDGTREFRPLDSGFYAGRLQLCV